MQPVMTGQSPATTADRREWIQLIKALKHLAKEAEKLGIDVRLPRWLVMRLSRGAGNNKAEALCSTYT